MSAPHRFRRLLAIPALLALLAGVGCGQYAGVHRDPVAAPQPSLASDREPVGPDGQPEGPVTGTGRGKDRVVPGEDGAEGPEGADIVGGGGPELPGKGGGPGNGTGNQGPNGPDNPSGPSGPKTSDPNNPGNNNNNPPPGVTPITPSGPTTGPTTAPTTEPTAEPATGPSDPEALAELISEQTIAGAEYNSTILPAGFPFVICPIQGDAGYAYSDDYGAPRYSGGYHPHAGNDLFSETGAPIVAPFAGYVERVPNSLGGLAVKVHGAQGYVYMAHLVAYGVTEKDVLAGQVVGYVGTSGNAQGTHPHNHFEWHPNEVQPFDEYLEGANGAVNPFPYLRIVCPPG